MAADYEKPVDPELPDTGPTFREFATAWTSGELAQRFPDHIRVKKTAEHDVYRLDAHVPQWWATSRSRGSGQRTPS